jgi:RimJ/RimL family protein N-acetyltransferase
MITRTELTLRTAWDREAGNGNEWTGRSGLRLSPGRVPGTGPDRRPDRVPASAACPVTAGPGGSGWVGIEPHGAEVVSCGQVSAIVKQVELVRTERLVLRHWKESDLSAFFGLYSREDVMRWLGPYPRRALANKEEARERLHRWHDRARGLDPPLGYWAIVPLTPGTQPVGTIPLLPLADASGPTGLTEVGWHLHPQHQGRGLVTEAAKAILAAAAEAGIEQVLALTDPDNLRSQAVAARLSMRDEGITRRWFGLTSRQYRKVIACADDRGPDMDPACSPRTVTSHKLQRPLDTRNPHSRRAGA